MQHYQRNVIAITKWCETCGKMTRHRVSDRRVGSCMESHVTGLSKKQEAKLRQEIKQFELDKRNEKQPTLFGFPIVESDEFKDLGEIKFGNFNEYIRYKKKE